LNHLAFLAGITTINMHDVARSVKVCRMTEAMLAARMAG
jgi:hypothetical protein